ncbi:SH3-domain-containing protein [Tothia fuscella]|uniref:SH3-domain-containing protein n=1 Tax=Tothia fuscella TaxID=1048955 RepID=A0A9P4U2I6_9PEZI|nr:SH3-domain-containing protein [Tothia fuscella]
MAQFNVAMTNRSLRTIRAELEFLADSEIITQQQLSTILGQLPADSASGQRRAQVTPSPAPPVAAMSNLNVNGNNGYPNEKQNYFSEPVQANPPPAYPSTPAPPQAPPLTHATALYAYQAADAGDLSLSPNDRVAVTEYMNAEWWKGSNERTGQVGIFPRSYVRVEEKSLTPGPQPSNYGNMPLDVSQSAGEPAKQPGKGQEMGKKFGKKLGNAAVFGAGATIGGKIVNGIF